MTFSFTVTRVDTIFVRETSNDLSEQITANRHAVTFTTNEQCKELIIILLIIKTSLANVTHL